MVIVVEIVVVYLVMVFDKFVVILIGGGYFGKCGLWVCLVR